MKYTRFTYICMFVFFCILICGCTQQIPLPDYTMLAISKDTFLNTAAYRCLALDEQRQLIYAADNTNKKIDILDDEGQYIESLSGFMLNNTNEVYEGISDISIYDEKLYVASAPSNRVDIYDIPENRIIMSLGTGRWQGDQSKGVLVHPKGVLATDRYIFVASQSNHIAVYRHSDITAENHKKALKFSFLKLDESLWNTDRTYMEVIDNKLYVSDEGKDRLYVFDIAQIVQTDINHPIQPVSVTVNPAGRRMNGISYDGSLVCTAQGTKQGGYIVFYTMNDFVRQYFDSPVAVFTDIRAEKFGNAKNVYLYDDTLFFTAEDGIWKTRVHTYTLKE